MKLGDICKIKYGKDHKKLNDGHIPVYGSGGVMRYVDSALWDKPSVLIPRKGTLDNLFFVDVPFWTVDTLFWTDINVDIVLPEYLFYQLKTKDLASLNVGTAVPSLTTEILNEVEIDLLPLEEQKQVVRLLGTIDDKIALNTKLNGYLEECLLAKYDELFDAEAPFNGTLADISEIVGGATPSKKNPEYYCRDGIGWITPRDLSNTCDKFIAHGADDITDIGFNSCSVKLLPRGSVLFSSRAPIGYIAIASNAVTTNQGFKSVIPHEHIGTAFVYCYLVRNKQRIADMGAGTTFPEVSGKMMRTVELCLPDVSSCAELSAFAEPLFSQQYTLECENRELMSLRDALLPKLMSGEIDVTNVGLHGYNNRTVE